MVRPLSPRDLEVPLRVHTDLSSEPLMVDAAHHWVADPAAGAVVVFTGTTRDHTGGYAVTGLSYEAFAERVVRQLPALAADLGERWPDLCAVWLTHRVGEVGVGEPSVVVAVSAPHRAEAFEAAREGIERLKAEAAIWKKEHLAAGGERWRE